jgi:trk system potassium uptake protein TrkA
MAEYVAVLGLSTFARTVATDLEMAEMKVLAVDLDESRIDSIKDEVTKAICGDLRNHQMLMEIGVADCAIAILGLPDHFDISVLVVHFLSNRGVKNIIVQVNSEDEAAAIEKVGATRVIFPERIAAGTLVRSLTLPGLADRIDLTEDAAVIEIGAPRSFVGRSLKGLDLRKRFNVHVVGLIVPPENPREKPTTVVAPAPEDPLTAGTLLLVLGKTNRLRNFARQVEKIRQQDAEGDQ